MTALPAFWPDPATSRPSPRPLSRPTAAAEGAETANAANDACSVARQSMSAHAGSMPIIAFFPDISAHEYFGAFSHMTAQREYSA